MTSHQDRRAGRTQRDEVEDVLGLVPGATAAEADALVALFASATAPISAGELPGEAAAVAAFRAAQPPALVPSRTGRIRATALTVKTAAAALLLTSVGGVALAATTDVLPAPLTIGGDTKPSTPDDGRGSTDREDAAQDAAQDAAVRDAAKAAAASDRADAKAGRESSYSGLCKAFTAGAWDNARAAGNPAFSRLVSAAPNGDVTGFCAALAAEAPAGKNTAPGREKSAEAREKAAENGKAPAKPDAAGDKGAEARERAADNSKAPAKQDKAADKAKADAKRDTAGKSQRSQLSR